jgi:site-specific DNA-methyltransferase (adenine-specific)
VSILHKVQAKGESSIEQLVSARKPFGLDTLFHGSRKKQNGFLTIYDNEGVGYISASDVTKNKEWIDRWKVFIPEAGSGSDAFPHPILGKPFVGEPGSVSSETYLVIGPFSDEETCQNVVSYIKTKFFRFLVMLKKPSQHATSKVYTFAPVQDFARPWTDEQLYIKYGISAEEIAFIDSMIKPMDLGGDE